MVSYDDVKSAIDAMCADDYNNECVV